MNWRRKAAIQRWCARVPAFHERIYYLLQRTFGSLRNPPNPFPMLEACAELVGYLQNAGIALEGARIMEVGTGRAIDMPLGLFLCGAGSVITFDLHRYLKPSLVMESVAAINHDHGRTRNILGPVTDPGALNRRLATLAGARDCNELMRQANIEYRAPADAARTGLPAGSIDIQVSYTVFEHIPRNVLHDILVEANHILAPGGVALHHIDPSDHFSHEDRSILPINFLQYAADEWESIAGNQFAYHNRMRADEFASLYSESGHEVVLWKPYVDARSREALESGFPLDADFRKYSPDVLSTVVLQVLSRPSVRS